MTKRQEKFVEVYLRTGDALAAAREAGYKVSGLSGALRILDTGSIRRALPKPVSRESEVLTALEGIAFGEASDAAGAEVKIAGKLRALELLGKHMGLFEGRAEALPPVTILEDV